MSKPKKIPFRRVNYIDKTRLKLFQEDDEDWEMNDVVNPEYRELLKSHDIEDEELLVDGFNDLEDVPDILCFNVGRRGERCILDEIDERDDKEEALAVWRDDEYEKSVILTHNLDKALIVDDETGNTTRLLISDEQADQLTSEELVRDLIERIEIEDVYYPPRF